MDDGSTDDTKALIDDFNDERIQYIYKKNGGVSSARNLGIKNSKGSWVAFLDSDDEWLPKKLELQIKFIQDNPELKIVHGEENWIRNGKVVNKKKIHKKHEGDVFLKCLPLCFISPSTSIIKKSLLIEVGCFDEEFEVCEDYDLWLKITSLVPVGLIQESIINKHGGHEDQLSFKYKAMDYWRVMALVRILETRNLKDEERRAVIDVIIRMANILRDGFIKHDNLEKLPYIEKVLKNFR